MATTQLILPLLPRKQLLADGKGACILGSDLGNMIYPHQRNKRRQQNLQAHPCTQRVLYFIEVEFQDSKLEVLNSMTINRRMY